MNPAEAGKAAYDAYRERSDLPMPPWERLDPEARVVWREVAKAVMRLAYRDARRNRKARVAADA